MVCLGAPLQTSLLQRWGAREREVLLQVTLRKGNPKEKEKGGRTKPNQKATPKTRIQENKMKKENQTRNLVTRPHPRKVFAYSSRKGCVGEEPTAHTSIRVHRHQDQQDLPRSKSKGYISCNSCTQSAAFKGCHGGNGCPWHSGRSF